MDRDPISLMADFPALFERPYCGVDFGPGWYKLLHELCTDALLWLREGIIGAMVSSMFKTKAAALKQLNKPLDLHALPRNEARVEIAKDVLAALKTGRLLAGTYYMRPLRANGEDVDIKPSEQLKAKLPEVDQCQVCAVGSAFVACVARVNDFHGYAMRGDMVAKLSPWFTVDELDLIENAFELSSFANSVDSSLGYASIERLTWRDYFFPFARTGRLVAIMLKIIEHKGVMYSLVDPGPGSDPLS